MKREFGKLSERPAVERVRAFLMSGRVRLAVLGCIRSGVRLEGVSDDRPGVVQCRTLWAELEQLKRGPADPSAPSSTAAPDPAKGPTASSGTAPDPGAEEDATLLDGMAEEHDPAQEAATNLTQANLYKVRFYKDITDVQRQLSGIVTVSAKICVLVDACTSKSKVPWLCWSRPRRS